jgi:SAM-dependent methyltransferase
VSRPKIIGDRLGRRVDALIRRAGRERSAEWYDRRFDRNSDYESPYNLSPYYFLWTVIADRIRRDGLQRVLEIGCGTGQLAALLLDQGVVDYVGLDFSAKAIEIAERAAPRGRFLVDDARHSRAYGEVPCDVLICTEVLEHIEDDLGVVTKFPPGTRCIFSVPSYESAGHVRHFATSDAVSDRYGPYFTLLGVATFPTAGSESQRIFLADGSRNDNEG